MANKKFNLINKKIFTIMYDNEDEDIYSIGIYFETKKEAVHYLVNVLLPEKERIEREGRKNRRKSPALYIPERANKIYWKATSLCPWKLRGEYHELDCQGRYDEEIPDERKNPTYLIRVIKFNPDNGKEYLKDEYSHSTDGYYYIDEIAYKLYKEIED